MASLGQLKMRLEQKKAKIAKLTAELKDARDQMAEIKEQIKTAKQVTKNTASVSFHGLFAFHVACKEFHEKSSATL